MIDEEWFVVDYDGVYFNVFEIEYFECVYVGFFLM